MNTWHGYPQDVWNEMQRDAMPTVYFNKQRHIKKTRKIHKCMVCQQNIPIGSSCEEITGMDDNSKKPYTQYYCGCA